MRWSAAPRYADRVARPVAGALCLLLMYPGGAAMGSDAARARTAPKGRPTIHRLGAGLEIVLGPPVVVALSRPGEKRWGFTQFPSLSLLPGGTLLCLFSRQADAVRAYGNEVPGCVSSNGGRSWKLCRDRSSPMIAPHGAITKLAEGEFLCVPPTPPMDTRKRRIELPPPALTTERSYCRNHIYRLSDFPEEIARRWGALPALRWSPGIREWRKTHVKYDTEGMLLWGRAETKGRTEGRDRFLLPRTWFERSPVRCGKELLYADYRSLFINPDGSVPRNFSPVLMVSTDNGRSFGRRATIATSADGKIALTEPALAVLAGGELACALRQADHRQLPLLMTYSKDGGRKWTRPRRVADFGVWPGLIQLECGVTVLSYGRPGAHLAFSENGLGRKWTEPLTLIAGDPKNLLEGSCGYTSLLALDESSFLVAYSDFDHRDANGRQRKAILVRRIEVKTRSRAATGGPARKGEKGR